MAPLRCLTYGSIASRHLANQKRVRQARDQRSVTQRMRRKLAGIFCFVVKIFNLVPRAFPSKNGGGPTHFLREKPWGRGWLILCFFKSHCPIMALGFFFPWRLANPNKNKILPRRFFGVSFRDAAAQKLNHSQTRKRSG